MKSSMCAYGDRFVKTVTVYTDRMLEQQAKISGEGFPLFADGFHVDTLKPVEWFCGGEAWVLSNLASQQNWLRLLCSLSHITGDKRYRTAAEQAVGFAFEQLRYGGLLQWGGHMAFDLRGKRPVYAPDKGPQHELKCHYPYYELMNEVNARETKTFIESLWNGHVLNWANLEFSRHGKPGPGPAAVSVWDREYQGGAPFFTGTGLTFINAGSDLYYAAAQLYRFTGDEKPLMWAKRLNGRYSDTRNRSTGLGGYQFSISVLPGIRGDRAIEQFGEQLRMHNPLEGTLSTVRQIRTIIGKAGLCRMMLAESLGEAGREFADTAVDDLLAYGEYAYEKETNLIHPVMTDGTRLTGLIMEKSGYYGNQGEALQASSADALLLWSYALGFRLSNHPQLWSIVCAIAKGIGLGDFSSDRSSPFSRGNSAPDCTDPYAIFALLELYRATGQVRYIELAAVVGDNMGCSGGRKNLFLISGNQSYAKLDNIAPLALLHLAAECRGIRHELPSYCGGSAFFGSVYDGMGHVTDQQLFYSRAGSIA